MTCYTVAASSEYYRVAKLRKTTVTSISLNNTIFVSYNFGRSLEDEIIASGIGSEDMLAKYSIDRRYDEWSNIYQLLILMDIYFVCEVDESGIVTRLFELDGNAIMNSDDVTVQDYFDGLSSDIDDAIREIDFNYGTGDMPSELLNMSFDEIVGLFREYRKL